MAFNTLISMLIQASLFALAAASETLTTTNHGNAWKYGSSGGVVGFVVLILDIIVFSMSTPTTIASIVEAVLLFAIIRHNVFRANRYFTVEVLKSNRPPLNKVLWCLVVFLFPIIGMVIYWLFSNRESHSGSGSYESIA
jgi:hypothetical protein